MTNLINETRPCYCASTFSSGLKKSIRKDALCFKLHLVYYVGIGLNMLPFAALVAYSLALHAALPQRRCSHSTGGSILQSRAYFPIGSCNFFNIR